MAAVTFDGTAPYYAVRVAFAAWVFDQLIVSWLEGDDLAAMVQAYGDEYEREFVEVTTAGVDDD